MQQGLLDHGQLLRMAGTQQAVDAGFGQRRAQQRFGLRDFANEPQQFADLEAQRHRA